MPTWNIQFDPYVKHYTSFSPSLEHKPAQQIKVTDYEIGRAVGFKRVSPHVINLPPGYRSSLPHAESHEEEFVFVISGTPDLCLNGYIYNLRPGYAVGFPAGTGIAHNLINNTDSEVLLLVGGERTKAENLCAFPFNLEMKEHKIWWANSPSQEFGPHTGTPGDVKSDEVGFENSPYIIDCLNEPNGKGYHYPGDSETFGEGFRLTDKIGLKKLGIWFERLSSGKRSAFPHAHTHEEEFIFVVSGKPTVWMNGYSKQMAPGWIAAFPSNTGVSHVLINDTDEEVTYICIGETEEFEGEKIVYPLNELRNLECKRKDWFWYEAPKLSCGSDLAASSFSKGDHIQLECLNEFNVRRSIEPSKTSFKEHLLIKLNGTSIAEARINANQPVLGECTIETFIFYDPNASIELEERSLSFLKDYIRRALCCEKSLKV